MDYVFISYKSDDYAAARDFRLELERMGVSCWMAPEDIRGGASYAQSIPAAIRGCKVFVLYMTQKVQSSRWVGKELDIAINEGKRIMPLFVEETALRDDFKFYLSNIQCYFAYGEQETDARRRFERELRQELSIPEPVPEKPAPEAPAPAAPVNTEIKPDPGNETKIIKVADFAPKETPVPEEKKKSKTKKRKLPMILGGSAAALIVIFFLIAFFGSRGSRPPKKDLTIAGKEYSSEYSGFEFKEQTITGDDIEILENLEKCTSLTFESCRFTAEDLFGLLREDLSALTITDCVLTPAQYASLDFSDRAVYRLNFTGLTLSDGSEMALSSLLPLAESLSSLSISRSGFREISALSQFKNLTKVALSGLGLTSLSPISELTKLTGVEADDNALTDLEPFTKLIDLTQLSVQNNKLTSLEGLENVTRLKTARLANNLLEDLGVLRKSAETLTTLDVSGNLLTSLAGISSCTALKTLLADNNQLTDLKAIAPMHEIETLSAAGNAITSFDGLQKDHHFTYVDLSGNSIETGAADPDAVALSQTERVYLDLSGNRVSKIAFTAAERFAFCNLAGNPIEKTELLTAPESFDELILSYSEKPDYAQIAAKVNKCVLADCPLDQQVNVRETFGAYKITFTDLEDALSNYTLKTNYPSRTEIVF